LNSLRPEVKTQVIALAEKAREQEYKHVSWRQQQKLEALIEKKRRLPTENNLDLSGEWLKKWVVNIFLTCLMHRFEINGARSNHLTLVAKLTWKVACKQCVSFYLCVYMSVTNANSSISNYNVTYHFTHVAFLCHLFHLFSSSHLSLQTERTAKCAGKKGADDFEVLSSSDSEHNTRQSTYTALNCDHQSHN